MLVVGNMEVGTSDVRGAEPGMIYCERHDDVWIAKPAQFCCLTISTSLRECPECEKAKGLALVASSQDNSLMALDDNPTASVDVGHIDLLLEPPHPSPRHCYIKLRERRGEGLKRGCYVHVLPEDHDQRDDSAWYLSVHDHDERRADFILHPLGFDKHFIQLISVPPKYLSIREVYDTDVRDQWSTYAVLHADIAKASVFAIEPAKGGGVHIVCTNARHVDSYKQCYMHAWQAQAFDKRDELSTYVCFHDLEPHEFDIEYA